MLRATSRCKRVMSSKYRRDFKLWSFKSKLVSMIDVKTIEREREASEAQYTLYVTNRGNYTLRAI